MNEIILTLIGVATLALAAPLGRIFGKFLKEQVNSIKHESLEHAAWVLVRAAENLFKESGKGREKFEYVMARLVKKFPWARSVKLEEFIEASVLAMRTELGNEESSLTE